MRSRTMRASRKWVEEATRRRVEEARGYGLEPLLKRSQYTSQENTPNALQATVERVHSNSTTLASNCVNILDEGAVEFSVAIGGFNLLRRTFGRPFTNVANK
ncbi:hypothetical protein QJS10_CPA09g01036 [Acorus calamus]|uniref:Uncharacterized protein n=1 Tax=Acorus calamus TaxID=4465 RepID=A0AAV9E5Z0_ACOCL|nr:hypothetical protein QJS10_CPA09g01036 [Acorus calamus]